MFNKLTDLSYKRSSKQAVGFYIFYFFIFMMLAALFTGTLSIVLHKTDDIFKFKASLFFAIVSSFGLAVAVVYKKKQQDNTMYVLLTIIAALLALFGAGLMGLIPAAYLSTKPSKSK
jgi:cytochrome c biogenesis factor